MSKEEIERQINRLKNIKGNLRKMRKNMVNLQHAARAAGQIHQWRANDLQEQIDKFFNSTDELLADLNRRLAVVSQRPE